jgi:hypothetical protein
MGPGAAVNAVDKEKTGNEPRFSGLKIWKSSLNLFFEFMQKDSRSYALEM